MRGIMLDCSRNGVMKPETVKHYVSIMAKMGYDTLMLYTEETYQVDHEPFFGYMRGRYTKEELKALNTTDYYQGGKIDPEWVKRNVQLPENVAFVYWNYYTTDRQRYADMIKVNKAFGRKVIFAGGAWSWKGF